jgi:hypothetical protein
MSKRRKPVTKELRITYGDLCTAMQSGPLLENVVPVAPLPGDGTFVSAQEAFEAWDSKDEEE